MTPFFPVVLSAECHCQFSSLLVYQVGCTLCSSGAATLPFPAVDFAYHYCAGQGQLTPVFHAAALQRVCVLHVLCKILTPCAGVPALQLIVFMPPKTFWGDRAISHCMIGSYGPCWRLRACLVALALCVHATGSPQTRTLHTDCSPPSTAVDAKVQASVATAVRRAAALVTSTCPLPRDSSAILREHCRLLVTEHGVPPPGCHRAIVPFLVRTRPCVAASVHTRVPLLFLDTCNSKTLFLTAGGEPAPPGS